MYPPEGEQAQCRCPRAGGSHSPTILYSVLSLRHTGNAPRSTGLSPPYPPPVPHSCPCDQRHAVCLKNPEAACRTAMAVLVKTIRFVTGLPSFHHLPPRDQRALLHNAWVPLFVLGLAQERAEFEVTDLPATSILKRILLSSGGGDGEGGANVEQGWGADCGLKEADRPTLPRVLKLKACLHRCWELDLSPKEYAYIKGAMLFNPDVPGLQVPEFTEHLQQEAHRALHEVLVTLHPQDQGRLTRIFLAASALLTIPHGLVRELFFRPIMGQTDPFKLLQDILTSDTTVTQEYTVSAMKKCSS